MATVIRRFYLGYSGTISGNIQIVLVRSLKLVSNRQRTDVLLSSAFARNRPIPGQILSEGRQLQHICV